MGIAWRDSPKALIGLLCRHGLAPERVDDVEAAWKAFCEFLAQPVEGLESEQDSDTDGFIVQWGRYGWNDRLPSLSFTRQFAVDVRAAWTEADWCQPEIWQVSLDMVFPDAPVLADLDRLNVQSTGFDFSPPGPERDHAIREAEWEIRLYPTLQALWVAVPLRSMVMLDRAD
jgi:hypothetical protein